LVMRIADSVSPSRLELYVLPEPEVALDNPYSATHLAAHRSSGHPPFDGAPTLRDTPSSLAVDLHLGVFVLVRIGLLVHRSRLGVNHHPHGFSHQHYRGQKFPS